MKLARKIGDQIEIRFTSNNKAEFQSELDRIKLLPNRQWNKKTKRWYVPNHPVLAQILIGWGYRIPLPNHQKPININLPDKLYPFQKEGIKQLEAWNGRGVLADEPGLGKTWQSLEWVNLRSDSLPAVIVTPATLKYNWLNHINNLCKYNVFIASGKSKKELIDKNQNPVGVNWLEDLLIINYDIIQDWLDIIRDFNPKTVIFDEAHYIKNPKALRTKAAIKIARKCKHVIPITGTPIENRPMEFFVLLNLVLPELFSNRMQFGLNFCAGKQGPWGWDFTGSSNEILLNKIVVNSCMIRRKKVDVLPDLPEKTRSIINLEPDPEAYKEYRKAEENIIGWIHKNFGMRKAIRAARAEAFTKINYLKQLAFKCKEKAVLNWIDDFLESGEKLGVFCVNHEAIDTILKRYKKIAVKIDGRTPKNDRVNIAKSFQYDDKIRLFIGSFKAAGVGIDLFPPSNFAAIQYEWDPGKMSQASDRFHRIGQKSNVNEWWLVANKTIEQNLIKLLDKKQKIIDNVIDGHLTDKVDILDELIKEMKG
jgi:SWI/SNF-related matrix-associated actin-dependent regulator 1 of chromatin subfamily A